MWLLALLALADTTQVFVLGVSPAESLEVTVVRGPAVAREAPVVLIPGLFGSAFAYRGVIPKLTAAGYRVIVIEPLGVGSSARPERADYSLTAQADRIATALDQLGIVALEGGPAEAAATPGFRRAMRLAPWVKLFGGARLIRNKIRAYLIAASGATTWVSEAVMDGYTAGAARDLDGTLKAYIRMARSRERERLRSHLGEIRCPVRLIIGGAPHDGAPPPEEVALLAAALPAFAVDTVTGAGHFLYEERPQAVVAAVLEAAP